MSDAGRLLQFKPRSEPVTIKPTTYGPENCNHRDHGLLVDENKRTVECAACHVVLDPIQALMNLCYSWRRWERETEARKRVLVEYNQHEADKARRYNDRHRKRHPDSETSKGCYQCANCESNERRYKHLWASA